MNNQKIKSIIRNIIIIIAVSVLIEGIVVLYNFSINKLYKKFNLIGNETVRIEKENLEISDEKENSCINIKDTNGVKIYNISLVMKQKNKDVYLRVVYNNDAKFIPKENADATKFKVYFLKGITTEEFKIVYPKTQIDVNNIESVLINDNIDYMPDVAFSVIEMIVIFAIITTIYLFVELYKNLNLKERKIKKELIFLVLSVLIGIGSIFINVPQVRYDEHAHFWRAYEISQGSIISKTSNELPTSIINLFEREDGSYPNKEMNYKTISDKITQPLNPQDRKVFPVGATGSLTPISYIPQVIGVIIGRIVHLSPIMILWLGRATNLAAYILLIYLAIKIIPSEKWKAIIMIIALFPMSINLATTLSPDAIILSNSLLAISYALYLKFKCEKVNIGQIAILGVLIMIPTVCKIVYFPLLLIFFIIPKEKFKNNKNRIISFICMILLIFVPYLTLNKIASFGDTAMAIRTNTTEQILFTISDLTRDFGTAINTFYSELSKYFFEMIGGWNTIDIVSIAIFIVLLVTMVLKDKEETYKFTKNDKIIIWTIVLIEILGITAALYLAWTQAKQTVVEGIQGRYFLPTIPLISMVLSKKMIEWNTKNKSIKYIMFVLIAFMIVFVFSIRSYC